MPRNPRPRHGDSGYLAGLTLLCNDPVLLERVLPRAQAGEVDAQYALGLMYAEGRGVPVDEAKAYVWLSRAVAQGDVEALELRRMLISQMSGEAIALAERQLQPDLVV